MKNKRILVVTNLYLFPNREIKRGGIMIHNSLINMSQLISNIEVAFFVPMIWSFVKCFKFNWKQLSFESYKLDGITVYPIFYFPRLSKILPKLDIFLKMLVFDLFYKNRQIFPVDLIYGQTLYPDGILLPRISKKFKVPYIVNMRGSDVHNFSANNQMIRYLTRKVLNDSLMVISVSERLKDVSVDVFGKNYVNQILYTSCKTEIFKCIKPISPKLKEIIFVGALIEAKGIYELLEAFAILVKSDKDYRLTLVGGGNKRILDIIIKEKEIKKQVIFKGLISNTEELVNELNRADILLFPSHNEGLPNAVVEGVACERVVICTDVGGVREITNQNLAFQVIPPRNVNAIIKAIKKLETVTVEKLRSQANSNRKKIIERFSPNSQLITFKKILEKVGEKS